MNFLVTLLVLMTGLIGSLYVNAQCTSETISSPAVFNLNLRSSSLSGTCRDFTFRPGGLTTIILVFTLQNIDCSRDSLIVFGDGTMIYDVCQAIRSNTNVFYTSGNYMSMTVRATISSLGSINSAVNFISIAGISNATPPPLQNPQPQITPQPITPVQPAPQPITPIQPAPPLPIQTNCGLPSITPNTNLFSRIVGGEEAIKNSWPWQAFITDSRTICGASLINSQWLITAAHCVVDSNMDRLTALLGAHDRTRTESTQQRIRVVQRIVHPNYEPNNNFNNDIALLRLATPVQFSREISPICLPPAGVEYGEANTFAYATGWGVTSANRPSSPVLRQVRIPILANSRCNLRFTTQICAGGNTPIADICFGDSGGPLMSMRDNRFYLVGIVSWTYGCNGRSGFIRVSSYLNWINNNVR